MFERPGRVVTMALGIGAACALAGCSAGATDARAAAPGDGASYALVQTNDWYFDEDGSIVILHEEPKALTIEEVQSFSAACDNLAVVGVDILPDGRIGAVMLDLGGVLGLEPGDAFNCNSIAINPASGVVEVDAGAASEACCQMTVQYFEGVTRLSCSGECDDGSSCALETEDDGGITVYTCGCPASP